MGRAQNNHFWMRNAGKVESWARTLTTNTNWQIKWTGAGVVYSTYDVCYHYQKDQKDIMCGARRN
jgi:hypothetical protein